MDGTGINADVLRFFAQHPDALPLYEALAQRVFRTVENTVIKVQKTQISFYNRRLFACVSFARVRKKADCPEPFLVVTFGLDHKVESPRVDVATEPYPNRWTHHVLLSNTAEIDEELMGWIQEAGRFAAAKR